jgi:hypothetical protein
MLDRILAAVGGTSGQAVSTAHQADRTAVDDRLDRPSRVQEEMLQAIKDVKAGLAAGTTAPAAPEPERAPAEVTVRGKQRLQKRLFGADPA